MCDEHLIVFTRYPEIGKVKTRLIPKLGDEGATILHRKMAEKMLGEVREFQQNYSCSVEVCFSGRNEKLMAEWLGNDFVYQTQGDGNLGDRLSLATQEAFKSGKSKVIIIGTDCPSLTSDILEKAFISLQTHPIVIGPATDGGYYLIGLQKFVPEIFQGVAWSTSIVFQQTLEICQRLNLSVATLPTLSDVDRPEDLPENITQLFSL